MLVASEMIVDDLAPAGWGLGSAFRTFVETIQGRDSRRLAARVNRVVFRDQWNRDGATSVHPISETVAGELRFWASALASMPETAQRWEMAIALSRALSVARATERAEAWLTDGLTSFPQDASFLRNRRVERKRRERLLHRADELLGGLPDSSKVSVRTLIESRISRGTDISESDLAALIQAKAQEVQATGEPLEDDDLRVPEALRTYGTVDSDDDLDLPSALREYRASDPADVTLTFPPALTRYGRAGAQREE